jgi:integrase
MSSLSGETTTLVEQFLRSGLYLRNWSKRTVHTYRQSLKDLPFDITKNSLEGWLIGLRERGLTQGGINLRIRSVNSFLSWLHDEEHIPSPLKLKLLKAPHRQITALSPQDVKALLLFKAKRPSTARAWTLVLLDTGMRIDEALGLERSNVDLDAMTLKCVGKATGSAPSRSPSICGSCCFSIHQVTQTIKAMAVEKKIHQYRYDGCANHRGSQPPARGDHHDRHESRLDHAAADCCEDCGDARQCGDRAAGESVRDSGDPQRQFPAAKSRSSRGAHSLQR